MRHVFRIVLFLLLTPLAALAEDITPFVGSYSGSAEFIEDGETKQRDMSVRITETNEGFTVSWTSVTYKPDGRTKEKTHTVEFVPSPRENIYASAMKVNVFGKPEPLNPLQGEPYVWSRFDGTTLTVFSLFINEMGDYEMQEYHRTLVEGGLNLNFKRFNAGKQQRAIETFLKRE